MKKKKPATKKPEPIPTLGYVIDACDVLLRTQPTADRRVAALKALALLHGAGMVQ